MTDSASASSPEASSPTASSPETPSLRNPDKGLRLVLGAVGVGFAAWGGWKMVTTFAANDWWPVLRWGVAGIVVHDALLAPIGIALGVLVFRRVNGAARPLLRAGLLGLASVGFLVLALAGARTNRQNPTVLPTDPQMALLFGVGSVVLGLVVAAIVARLLRSVRSRRGGGTAA